MLKTILVLAVSVNLSYAASVKKPKAAVEDRPAPAVAPAPIVLTTSAPNFCVFGAQSGKDLSGEASFKATVWKSDVVYVGETHDEPLDHQAQFEALKAMRIARGSRIAVAFEMLTQPQQKHLDDYAAGLITQEEFLSRVDWKKEWGFDFGMYKPLFDFMAANKLRGLALNVPREIVKKVARGGLESLSEDDKKYLPEKVEISAHKKYNEYLKKSFDGHGGSPMAKMFTFENYAASMAAWNEGMGWRVAEFLDANPGWAVLVIAGNGHLAYNAAIPASVKSRVKGVRQASFYTETAARCPAAFPKEHKDLANYIWYINHPPKPEPPAAPAASTAAPAAAQVPSLPGKP